LRKATQGKLCHCEAYNNSIAVSNSAEIIQSWADLSKTVRDSLKGDLNVAYGPGARQCFDSYSAGNNSPIKQTNHFGKSIDIFVGRAELPAMQMQTNDFYKYRQDHAQPGKYTLLSGLNHYTVFDQLVNEDGEVLVAILKILR
jgi:hypothetical protein